MQIVIDIPEEVYKFTVQNGVLPNCDDLAEFYDVDDAIVCGTPLPPHGRLIDADKLKLSRHDIYIEEIDYRHRCISLENVDEAQTVLKGNKDDL